MGVAKLLIPLPALFGPPIHWKPNWILLPPIDVRSTMNLMGKNNICAQCVEKSFRSKSYQRLGGEEDLTIETANLTNLCQYFHQ